MGRTISFSITPEIDLWIRQNWEYDKSGKFREMIKTVMGATNTAPKEENLLKHTGFRRMSLCLKDLRPIWGEYIKGERDAITIRKNLSEASKTYSLKVGDIVRQLKKEVSIYESKE